MADAVCSGVCSARNLVNSNGETEISNCIKCSTYENQLREAHEELSSLKLIKKFLQKELFAYTTHKSTWEIDQVSSDRNDVPADYNGWSLVTSTNLTDKSKTRIKGKIAKFSQPVKTANRYSPLSDALTSSEGTIANGVKKLNKSLSPKETISKGVIGTRTDRQTDR
jgi:hypothetical protein